MKDAWDMRSGQDFSTAVSQLEVFKRFVFIAVDAATNEQNDLPPQAAVVEINPKTKVAQAVYGRAFPKDKHIAYGELYAIWLAVEK